jgi:hypothetical protein
MFKILFIHCSYSGLAIPDTRVHPPVFMSDTAAQIGPHYSAWSSKATPRFLPFRSNDRVPRVISKQTPKTPLFLKGFPYFFPFALLPFLSYPVP